jgi:hypothetical protein
MGNAEEVGEESNSTYEDDGFESQIDDILGEVERENGDGEGVDKQMEMAFGGYVGSGTDITKAPKNPVFDVRYYKGPNEQVMFVTHINGKPMTPIPEGFKAVSMQEAQKVGLAADEAKAKTTQPAGGALSGQEGPEAVMPTPTNPMTPMQVEQLGKTLQTIPSIITKGLGKGLSAISDQMAQQATLTSMEAVAADAQAQAPSAPATASQSASNAAVAAATASINAGHSNEASIAAANAAATAINNGATAEQAASIAAGAAAAVDAGADTSGNIGPDVGDSVTGVDGVYAKGGFVGKRQYPTKKKKGKGIVASK